MPVSRDFQEEKQVINFFQRQKEIRTESIIGFRTKEAVNVLAERNVVKK